MANGNEYQQPSPVPPALLSPQSRLVAPSRARNSSYRERDVLPKEQPRWNYETLTAAIYHRDLVRVRQSIDGGASLPAGHGSPLSLALEYPQNDIIRYLVERGAPLSLDDIWRCIQIGSLEMLKILTISPFNGASRSYGGDGHHLPVQQVTSHNRKLLSGHMLVQAGRFQQDHIIEYLVQEGVDVDAVWDLPSDTLARNDLLNDLPGDSTALHVASAVGSLACVDALILNGANIDSKDQSGRTPLMTAAASNAVEVVRYLITSGANIEAQDTNTFNMLDLALEHRSYAVVRLLMTTYRPKLHVTNLNPYLLREAVLNMDLDFAHELVNIGMPFPHLMFQQCYYSACWPSQDGSLYLARGVLLQKLQEQVYGSVLGQSGGHGADAQSYAATTALDDRLALAPAQGQTLDSYQLGDEGKSATIARFWMQKCLNSHGTCRLNEAQLSSLPARVLDVNSLRLREMNANERGFYVTLSHRWGTDQQGLKTTTSNLEKNKAQIPWRKIPRSLRNAIILVRALNLTYLWVDTLCILQDCEADKNYEISRMSQIYNASLLTIALVDANTNDDAGLPTVGFRPRAELDERAWVLQEQTLSRRVLSLTPTNLYWDCITYSASAKHLSGIPINYDRGWKARDMRIFKEGLNFGFFVSSKAPFEQYLHSAWCRIVEDFSQRKLTYEGDKLRALLGIANKLALIKQDRFVIGLWKKTLLLDLCWKAHPSTLENVPRRELFRAPTWSWLSVSCPVSLCSTSSYYPTFSKRQNDALVGMDLTEDSLSPSLYGRLRLRGNYAILRRELKPNLRHGYKEQPTLASMCDWDTQQPPNKQCILWWYEGMPRALILTRTGRTHSDGTAEYRRIGTTHDTGFPAEGTTTIDLV